jgi:hypothetical protein
MHKPLKALLKLPRSSMHLLGKRNLTSLNMHPLLKISRRKLTQMTTLIKIRLQTKMEKEKMNEIAEREIFSR